MARRILYDPAQFIEASTPMYENIVGAINDQAERIERNQMLNAKTDMMLAQQQFDVNMQERRITAQKELQADNIEARREEADIDRTIRSGEFSSQMNLEYLKLGIKGRADAVSAAMKKDEQLTKDYEKQINDVHETLVKSGFGDVDSEIGYKVGDYGNGHRVIDMNYITEGDGPDALPTPEQWLSDRTILHNISKNLLNGKNWREWARSNLHNPKNVSITDDGEEISKSGFSGTDSMTEDVLVTGDGQTLYGADAFSNMLINVQYQLPGWEESVRTLNDIMDADSKIGLLFKEDDIAEKFDQQEVGSTVNRIRGTLESLETFEGRLFNPDDKLAQFDLNQYLPNPVEWAHGNMGGEAVEGKNIHQLRKSITHLKQLSEQEEWGEKFERQEQAVRDLELLAEHTLFEYKDEMVPDRLKGIPVSHLVQYVKVNNDEYMRNFPNVKRLFTFPAGQIEQIAKEVDSGFGSLSAAEERARQKEREEREFRRLSFIRKSQPIFTYPTIPEN